MEEQFIKVQGNGAIHVVPDVTRIEVRLSSLHEDYQEAYEQMRDNVAMLSKIMTEVGLAATMPKTIRLDIDKETRPEYDSHRNHIGDQFVGFRLDHRVKIDLDMDTVLLNNIVRLIGERLKQAELNIGYTVRDPRPSQLRMLERAVTDAKDKAEIMAKACGCSLGAVKNINYSWQKLHVYSQARALHSAEEACYCNVESLDITPDDLAVSDDVTVEWYLTQDKSAAR